jgi:hypothetical protein
VFVQATWGEAVGTYLSTIYRCTAGLLHVIAYLADINMQLQYALDSK